MENKQEYPPMDHVLTGVKETEEFLTKNSIKFKVSFYFKDLFFIDFDTSTYYD